MSRFIRALGRTIGMLSVWLGVSQPSPVEPEPPRPAPTWRDLWEELQALEGQVIRVQGTNRVFRIQSVPEDGIQYAVRRRTGGRTILRSDVFELWEVLCEHGALDSPRILDIVATLHASYLLAMLGEAGAVTYETSPLRVRLRREWQDKDEGAARQAQS